MIDKLYRWIDGILIVMIVLAVTRIVTGIATMVMPENALASENAIAVAQEMSNVYYQGGVALMDYLLNNAFYEELIFRFLPIMIFAKWTRDNNDYKCLAFAPRTLVVVGICSIVFGWLHGGFWNIFVQGVYGVAFSAVFIFTVNKLPSTFGRMTKSVLGLAVSTLVHAFSNYAIILAAGY